MDGGVSKVIRTSQKSISQFPILVKAQVEQPFILTTDASDTHVGGVLSLIQSDRANKPVGYFSKKLNPCETRYSATDKEALAIVLLVETSIIIFGVPDSQ